MSSLVSLKELGIHNVPALGNFLRQAIKASKYELVKAIIKSHPSVPDADKLLKELIGWAIQRGNFNAFTQLNALQTTPTNNVVLTERLITYKRSQRFGEQTGHQKVAPYAFIASLKYSKEDLIALFKDPVSHVILESLLTHPTCLTLSKEDLLSPNSLFSHPVHAYKTVALIQSHRPDLFESLFPRFICFHTLDTSLPHVHAIWKIFHTALNKEQARYIVESNDKQSSTHTFVLKLESPEDLTKLTSLTLSDHFKGLQKPHTLPNYPNSLPKPLEGAHLSTYKDEKGRWLPPLFKPHPYFTALFNQPFNTRIIKVLPLP